MMQSPWLFRLSLFASALALLVVVLGAYVRLSHAGLGCPDWPGCYGHLDVPATESEIQQANEAYPQRPVEMAKAWKEMVHRYAASILGLLIIAMVVISWRARESLNDILLPGGLLVLVIFQGILGMWTVTLLLKPLVVTGHLLGGMATLSLLWWLCLRNAPWQWQKNQAVLVPRFLKKTSFIALAFLVLQIALGGWTSTNYSALACYGFPDCNQQWWPQMDFGEAFILWRGLGIDYEGGVLDHPARVAIHMTHRIGAAIVFLLFSGLIAYLLMRVQSRAVKNIALIIAALLLLQIILGIVNVTQALPLFAATAHNGVAALLVLSMVTCLHVLFGRRAD